MVLSISIIIVLYCITQPCMNSLNTTGPCWFCNSTCNLLHPECLTEQRGSETQQSHSRRHMHAVEYRDYPEPLVCVPPSAIYYQPVQLCCPWKGRPISGDHVLFIGNRTQLWWKREERQTQQNALFWRLESIYAPPAGHCTFSDTPSPLLTDLIAASSHLSFTSSTPSDCRSTKVQHLVKYVGDTVLLPLLSGPSPLLSAPWVWVVWLFPPAAKHGED